MVAWHRVVVGEGERRKGRHQWGRGGPGAAALGTAVLGAWRGGAWLGGTEPGGGGWGRERGPAAMEVVGAKEVAVGVGDIDCFTQTGITGNWQRATRDVQKLRIRARRLCATSVE
uniref:Uncharacterized protein n=1 Tax=Oryza meridionalis TaxID=40149 RepID=A0A0E0CVZ8_9ORYZ